MKLHVLFNRDGDILAATGTQDQSAVKAVPMVDEAAGHRSAELEVPADMRQGNLAEICRKLRVDAASGSPRLAARR